MSTPERIGKYEVVEEIGRGGFGTVYKARDPLMKRVVAIKLCSERDEDLRRRFLREAQIAGSLDHPSIVRGFDCGFDEAGVYLVEEYLDGEDLTHTIRSRLPLPYRARLAILIEVAQAIGYAHSKGVHHRDLKPGNIRILQSGRAKLMDFGIAKMLSSNTPLTKAGTLLGTAGYVAPEQVLGKPVDHRVDVFAFGALAYELLTYRRPFTGESVRERLRSVLETQPEPISAFWAECPSAVESVIFRCLKKDPAERYSSFEEVIADLERAHAAMKDAEEAPTVTFARDPALALPADAADATLATPKPPPADPDPMAGFEATLIAPAVPFVTPPPPPPPGPPPAPAVEAPPPADPTVVAPTVEPPRARPPSLSRTPRLWLVASIAALALLVAAIVVWVVVSGKAGTDTAPAAAAVAPVAPAPVAPAEPIAEPVIADKGRVVVNASPWGEVVEVIGTDGKAVAAPPGSSTPLVLSLAPGDYEVRVKRPGAGAEPPRSCRVSVATGSTVQCTVELGRVTGQQYFKESGWWQ